MTSFPLKRSLVAVPVFLAGLMAASTAPAALILTVGNHELQANQADQKIALSVSGDVPVWGLEFDLQVGDGGSDLGGVDVGPVITHIDLANGTLFSTLPNAIQTDVVAYPLAIQSTLAQSPGAGTSTVLPNGIFAWVTFDTTGLTSGTFDLKLSNVAGAFDTTFYDISGTPVAMTVTNGTLAVAVPEPGSLTVLAGIGVTLSGLRRPRRQSPA